jgi:hypothetical protein
MYVWEQLHVWERGFRAACAEAKILRTRRAGTRVEYTKFSTQYSLVTWAISFTLTDWNRPKPRL